MIQNTLSRVSNRLEHIDLQGIGVESHPEWWNACRQFHSRFPEAQSKFRQGVLDSLGYVVDNFSAAQSLHAVEHRSDETAPQPDEMPCSLLMYGGSPGSVFSPGGEQQEDEPPEGVDLGQYQGKPFDHTTKTGNVSKDQGGTQSDPEIAITPDALRALMVWVVLTFDLSLQKDATAAARGGQLPALPSKDVWNGLLEAGKDAQVCPSSCGTRRSQPDSARDCPLVREVLSKAPYNAFLGSGGSSEKVRRFPGNQMQMAERRHYCNEMMTVPDAVMSGVWSKHCSQCLLLLAGMFYGHGNFIFGEQFHITDEEVAAHLKPAMSLVMSTLVERVTRRKLRGRKREDGLDFDEFQDQINGIIAQRCGNESATVFNGCRMQRSLHQSSCVPDRDRKQGSKWTHVTDQDIERVRQALSAGETDEDHAFLVHIVACMLSLLGKTGQYLFINPLLGPAVDDTDSQRYRIRYRIPGQRPHAVTLLDTIPEPTVCGIEWKGWLVPLDWKKAKDGTTSYRRLCQPTHCDAKSTHSEDCFRLLYISCQTVEFLSSNYVAIGALGHDTSLYVIPGSQHVFRGNFDDPDARGFEGPDFHFVEMEMMLGAFKSEAYDRLTGLVEIELKFDIDEMAHLTNFTGHRGAGSLNSRTHSYSVNSFIKGDVPNIAGTEFPGKLSAQLLGMAFPPFQTHCGDNLKDGNPVSMQHPIDLLYNRRHAPNVVDTANHANLCRVVLNDLFVSLGGEDESDETTSRSVEHHAALAEEALKMFPSLAMHGSTRKRSRR